MNPAAPSPCPAALSVGWKLVSRISTFYSHSTTPLRHSRVLPRRIKNSIKVLWDKCPRLGKSLFYNLFQIDSPVWWDPELSIARLHPTVAQRGWEGKPASLRAQENAAHSWLWAGLFLASKAECWEARSEFCVQKFLMQHYSCRTDVLFFQA